MKKSLTNLPEHIQIQLRQGQDEAIAYLFDYHKSDLDCMAKSVTNGNSKVEVEELVQELYLKISKKDKTFLPEEKIETGLFRALRRVYKDIVRGRMRKKRGVENIHVSLDATGTNCQEIPARQIFSVDIRESSAFALTGMFADEIQRLMNEPEKLRLKFKIKGDPE